MIYIMGPGHGGPGPVAAGWLEGTYSETYPDVGQDLEGMKQLFKQFSFPGGIPSHVAPETPGSIHEGGGNWNTLSHTPTGQPSTTPTLLLRPWWATGRRKPARWQPAGTPISS